MGQRPFDLDKKKDNLKKYSMNNCDKSICHV